MFNCQLVFSYYPKGAKRCRCTVPASLRPVLLNSLHNSVLSEHLRVVKHLRILPFIFHGPRCGQSYCIVYTVATFARDIQCASEI
jgi:hypothetical protein